ncbi:MAG: bifunctional glycosyltransferase family 2/GtrA family protein [Christensenellaceae bacterium]|jgi:putative flippase GtrA|nr:bifunctional glycosyltransferase family 2/GtrA family protein [Christensenellaceae bacterium]
MRVKVLIPAYRPQNELLLLLKELIPQAEALVVDDGSGAEFADVFDSAQRLGATVLRHEQNCGKGAAIKTGIRYLCEHEQGTGIVTADADGQHSAQDILRILNAMQAQPEAMILGVRDINKMPLRSFLGNTITRFVFWIATKRDISDTQTGLRGLPPALFDRLLRVPGNRYEYEMNMLLALKGWNIAVEQIPIDTIYIGNNEQSHFNALRDGARVISRVLKFCVSSLLCMLLDFGLYALLLLWLPAMGAYVAARAISANVNYQINRRIVFRAKRSARSAVGYFALAVCFLIIGSLSVSFLTRLGLNTILAKALVDGVLFIANYILQNKILFRGAR